MRLPHAAAGFVLDHVVHGQLPLEVRPFGLDTWTGRAVVLGSLAEADEIVVEGVNVTYISVNSMRSGAKSVVTIGRSSVLSHGKQRRDPRPSPRKCARAVQQLLHLEGRGFGLERVVGQQAEQADGYLFRQPLGEHRRPHLFGLDLGESQAALDRLADHRRVVRLRQRVRPGEVIGLTGMGVAGQG